MKFHSKGCIQKTMLDSVPKVLTMVSILFTSLVATAQYHSIQSAFDRKEINIGEAFQQVEVRGDVTLVLSNGPAGGLLLEGNQKDISGVKTILKNGQLVIDAAKKKSFAKLVVYIPAADIKSLIVYGAAEIFSSGKIKTPELEIILNGESFVTVNYEGIVKVTAGEEYYLEDGRDHRK
ncbi:MAG: DUF2807 domain-containing protein [Ferruginibacter sp.]|nr:DUF2807 domain-containing protein [Ferruginibacter sp.]